MIYSKQVNILEKADSSLLVLPYLVMICAGMCIPSDGNHGFFTLKSLAFIFSIFAVCAHALLKRKLYVGQLRTVVFMLISVGFLLIWLVIGQVRDVTENNPFDQFKVFFITLSVIFVTLYWLDEKAGLGKKILKAAIYTNFLYSFMKVAFVCLHLLHIISIFELMRLTGVRFMTMGIYGQLMRMQTSVDIITPFLLFFVLQSDRLGLNLKPKFKLLYIAISWLSIFLSFSRYLMFVGLLSHMLYWSTLHLSRIMTGICLLFTTILIGMSIIGFDVSWQIIERRFFSQDNFQSDQTRVHQVNALMEEQAEYCYFGKGLGGYTKNCIRDHILKHSYEVQWVAFLMQFGLVGILFLLIPPGIICWKLIYGKITRIRLSFLMLFGVWLMSGFTNPLLISMNSGIIYSLFLIIARELYTLDYPPKIADVGVT